MAGENYNLQDPNKKYSDIDLESWVTVHIVEEPNVGYNDILKLLGGTQENKRYERVRKDKCNR